MLGRVSTGLTTGCFTGPPMSVTPASPTPLTAANAAFWNALSSDMCTSTFAIVAHVLAHVRLPLGLLLTLDVAPLLRLQRLAPRVHPAAQQVPLGACRLDALQPRQDHRRHVVLP